MKNDRIKVAKLANQATNPGTAAPGTARAREVEVVAASVSPPALVWLVLVAWLVGEEVDEARPNPPPLSVRLETAVNTRALVVTGVPKSSQRVARRVMMEWSIVSAVRAHVAQLPA
jgi:hypothetical protein